MRLIKVAFKPWTCADPAYIPVLPHNSTITALITCNKKKKKAYL
jgi:hypothetical protein